MEIKINFENMNLLQHRLNKLAQEFRHDVIKQTAEIIQQKTYQNIQKNTPVRTGYLKKAWQTDLTETDNGQKIEFYNYAEYWPYVEYGHRTKDHKSFVQGFFMSTISLQQAQIYAPTIAHEVLTKKIREVGLDDK